MYSRNDGKSIWVLILMMLAGIVIGGFIGSYLGQLQYMQWLQYGDTFGMSQPLILELGIINVQFGFTMKFSIAGLIGMIVAIIAYKKL